MLRQGIDTEQRLIPPGPFPVGQDLALPEHSPLLHEAQGSVLKASSQHIPVHRYLGTTTRMVSVEMGDRVITLVPVHVDHHAVEGADTRHD
jgi:hypothetical protein